MVPTSPISFCWMSFVSSLVMPFLAAVICFFTWQPHPRGHSALPSALSGTSAGNLEEAFAFDFCWIVWAPDLMMFCWLSVVCLSVGYLFALASYILNNLTHSTNIVVLIEHSLDCTEHYPCMRRDHQYPHKSRHGGLVAIPDEIVGRGAAVGSWVGGTTHW